MKRFKIGLLGKIVIAIIAGVGIGMISPEWIVRIFLTFNGIFSQFLGFAIPLIILGLVTTAIADIGKGAGRMLILTVAIAYGSTILAGITAYLTGAAVFPSMIAPATSLASSIVIPPLNLYLGLYLASITYGSGHSIGFSRKSSS